MNFFITHSHGLAELADTPPEKRERQPPVAGAIFSGRLRASR